MKPTKDRYFSTEYSKGSKKMQISIDDVEVSDKNIKINQTRMNIDKREAKRIVSLLNEFIKSK